jgi:hypothetical protein
MGLLDGLLGRSSAKVAWAREGGEPALCLAWAGGGGALAVGRSDGTVEVMDGKTGQTRGSELVHEDGLLAMAADPLGTLVLTGGADGKAVVLDATSFERKKSIDTAAKTKGAWVEHVAFSPDGAFVAIAAGKLVWLGQVRGGSDLFECGPHASTVAGLAFRADGKELAVARYGGADVWSIEGSHVRALPWQSSLVSIAWQPQGRYLAAGCQDDAVHFWRLDTFADSMMGGYPSKPRAIAWSQDGDLLATGGGHELVVWSFKGKGPEGTTPRILKGHEGLVTVIAASPKDQRFASGGRDGRVHLWRPQRSDRPVMTLELGDVVHALAFSGDGRLAAGAANGSVVVARLP